MVCKNCGADLKPGIKYCLECGSYLDDEDDDEFDESGGELDTDYKPITLGNGSGRKKKKRLRLTVSDYLIYAGLLIVMIGSIIVIIVALVKNNSQTKQPVPAEIVEQDKSVTIDNYTVTVPGALNSTVQGSTLYVSDNVNYTFSYQNTLDNFDAYADDHTLLEQQLIANKYEVVSSDEKIVNSRTFLLYQIKVNGVLKVLYLTKANSQYTTMGMIEIMSNDKWSEALNAIDTINNSITFDSTLG